MTNGATSKSIAGWLAPTTKKKTHRAGGGYGAGRGFGGGNPGGVRLPGQKLLHSRFSPPRPQHCPPRGALTPPKTIPTTATACGGCSTTRLKGATTAPARPTFTVWQKLAAALSTSAWPRGCPLRGNTGGLLDNRSFGGAQVSRTFYARGQTGQQLLLGAYSAMMRMVQAGGIEVYARREMLDLVVINGQARGIIVRNLVTGGIRALRRRCRAALHRRLRQCVLPLYQRQKL